MRLLAGLDERDLVLVHIGKDPEMGEIGNAVEVHARGDVAAFQHHLLEHDPAQRRFDGHVRPGLARSFELLDLLRRDVPEQQPAFCRFQQFLAGRIDLGKTRWSTV